MANNIYPSVPQAALAALVASYPVVLSVHEGLSYDPAHEFFSDVADTIVAQAPIPNVTIVGGALKGDPVVMPAVESGSTINSYVVRIDTGDPETSPILCRIDTDGDSQAISEPTTGGDVTVTLDADGVLLFEIASNE